jgi:hypothetical protein
MWIKKPDDEDEVDLYVVFSRNMCYANEESSCARLQLVMF